MNHILFNATLWTFWGVLIHLFCDWMLQSQWQADNKTNVKHPAGYVHAGIHSLGLMLIFPWWLALSVGVTHFIIDTRVPLKKWGKLLGQDPQPPIDLHVIIWRDQVCHFTIIALASIFFTHFVLHM